MISIKRNVYDFSHIFLVVCPNCSQQSTLINHGNTNQPDIVFSCSSCKLMQQWRESNNEIKLIGNMRWFDNGNGMKALIPAPVGYQGARVGIWIETSPDTTVESKGTSFWLWLQMPCAGENLWFLNKEHLSFVQSYVRVPRRLRSRSFDTGHSREQILWVEGWIKEIKDKDKDLILNCLDRLQLRISSSKSPS